MDIESVISFVADRGKNLERAILGVHFAGSLSSAQSELCARDRAEYFEEVGSLIRHGAIPYASQQGNPASVFTTAQVLSNLLDLDLESTSVVETMVDWLLEQQDEDGWWSDDVTPQSVPDLPAWQDPANGSVRIFNLCVVLSVLSRITIYDIGSVFKKGMDLLRTLTTDNGAILGFPQSSWIITPAIARIHGLTSSRFLLHWSLLDNFVDKDITTSNLVTIARNLTLSQIEPEDTLLSKCGTMLSKRFDVQGKYAGWSKRGDLDSTLSLAALMVVEYLT